MKDRRFRALALAVIGSFAIATVVLAASLEWKAKPASGANEVPANASTASAEAHFALEGDVIRYRIKMKAPIENAFMGHIHVAAAGANGPIVVWLLGTPPANANPPIDYGKNELVVSGEFDASDFVGPLAGQPLENLITLLDNGGAYVNIHTTAFPGGEIRAQSEVSD
jgi:hypothetical protein